MPGPYHEYSRQQTAERVSKAYREGLAKQTRHARIGATRRSIFGLVIHRAPGALRRVRRVQFGDDLVDGARL